MTERRNIGWTLLPLFGFVVLAFVFWRGLSGNPQDLPSTLIGRTVPAFALPAIEGTPYPALSDADLKQGQVTLVNIFASWCAPCREEHPLLLELSKRDDIALAGINNKDQAENARRFLSTLGNPYDRIGADASGRVTIDWGGYGVPETFVVDGKGIIRFKIIGPITPEVLASTLDREIEKAKQPQQP